MGRGDITSPRLFPWRQLKDMSRLSDTIEKHPLPALIIAAVSSGGVVAAVILYFASQVSNRAEDRFQAAQQLAALEKRQLEIKVAQLDEELAAAKKANPASRELIEENKRLLERITVLEERLKLANRDAAASREQFDMELGALQQKVRTATESSKVELAERDKEIKALRAATIFQPDLAEGTQNPAALYRNEQTFAEGASFWDPLTSTTLGLSEINSAEKRVSGKISMPDGQVRDILYERVGAGWTFKWKQRKFLVVIAAVTDDKRARVILNEITE